ncbi:putative peptide transport permease protein [Acrocarpospora phusangensis]|uniref:Peptide transport permease protein n=1 Tax=Acrocarpospora phusangensis TaxID=1070424 RepID=A0A919QB71_9ACTN|nr:ABC transporter permease [Acrocarpospora phusangensis]GIH24519.1 putative peptide transport permease protein [Acrocarpospora phusangensis]
MAGFLARRLIGYVVLVAVAASVAYLLAAVALNPRANYAERTPRPPESAVDAQLAAYNLNDKEPLASRFATWAGGALRGDFGRTWNGASVNDDLGRRAGVTLRLVAAGLLLGAVAGIAVGACAAVGQYGWFDRLSTLASFGVLAVPTVVLANVLIIGAVWLNDLTGMKIFLVSGEATPGVDSVLDRLRHLVLPTLTLALGMAAVFSRYQRNMLLDVLGADFVRTARAKGLTRRAAYGRHALRVALIPVATYFAFTFGALLVGTTVTETIFGWYGLGQQLVASIRANDVNTVAAISCLAAVALLVAAVAADVLHAVLDPRVRAT